MYHNLLLFRSRRNMIRMRMPGTLFHWIYNYHWRDPGVKRRSAVLLLLLQPYVHGQLIVYEAGVFPEQDGWTRDAYCDPVRWIAGDWFWQHVESCDAYPPPGGQRESFRRSLAAFIGESTFFIEWRKDTDGDRSETGGVAPASLVASGTTGVNYHFTIARDQVRFWRDNFLPILFANIEPGIALTYRLELVGLVSYAWYIDGMLVDDGIPERAYPTDDSNVLSFRAKSWFLESTTRWDYIRYGVIPVDGSGDYDSDEDVDLRDFYFFHECLTNERPGINGGPEQDAGAGCRFADFDADTDVDLRDFATFQTIFTSSR